MLVLRLALLFPLILALGGCLGNDYANTSPEKLAAKISVKEDTLDNVLRFRAPNLSAGLDNTFQIRTTMDRENGYAAHVVYVKDPFFVANRGGYERDGRGGSASESNFRNYYTARDSEGNRFKVISGRKSFDGCDSSFCYYEETFGIVIPDDYLRTKGTSGMALRASSEAGVYMDLKFSANYVAGVLLRADQERTKLGY